MPAREASLAQYMVDIGDRRVFAGVHYPSDNIASWIMALSLMPEVYADPVRIEGFVRKAIFERSRVFQMISAAYFTDPRASSVANLLALYKLIPAAT
jgi:hypothetical protein